MAQISRRRLDEVRKAHDTVVEEDEVLNIFRRFCAICNYLCNRLR